MEPPVHETLGKGVSPVPGFHGRVSMRYHVVLLTLGLLTAVGMPAAAADGSEEAECVVTQNVCYRVTYHESTDPPMGWVCIQLVIRGNDVGPPVCTWPEP